MPVATNSSDSEQQLLWPRLFELLLILLVFFALAGDPAPHQNEPYYLCRLKHFWNLAWCAGDFYLDSADAHLMFVLAFGWITKWLSLSATAWTGRIFVWTLLAWAWQRLSWRVVPKPLFAVLSAALWVVLIDRANLAGEWVVGGFESKCVAYVFVLAAIFELISDRWNRVWLLLGAASAFHVLVGGWSVVVCAGVWLVDAKSRSIYSMRSMLPGLFGGGLLALFGVLPALQLTWHEAPDVVAEASRIYVFDRLPHHLSILTVPPDEVLRRLSRHGVLVVALALLTLINRRVRKATNTTQAVDSYDRLRLLNFFAWGSVALAATGLAIELTLWTRPDLSAPLLKFYWFRLTDFAVPMATALNLAALIADAFARRRAWAPAGLAATIIFLAVPLIYSVRQRYDNPVPPADSTVASFDDWVDVCGWISDNTGPTSEFISPRMGQSFKWRTGRREVVTRKDIPQDAHSIVEWSERLHDIYYHEVDGQNVPVDSVADLGTEHVRLMAEKYGADYVLANRDPVLKLPTEYANNTYVVYRIQP
ncbi:MAG TPA: DUF6798 domain-containing protein [Lacipirellulaceae bacterium]|jgi:hypothetical protein